MADIVVKRDGREKEFSELRVLNAVTQAYASVYNGSTELFKDQIKHVVDSICSSVVSYGRRKISVERINDFMINELRNVNEDVALSAIKYRKERERARRRKEYDTYREISNAVKNDITKENANMASETPAGMMMKYSSEVTKAFTKAELLDDVTWQAIEDNILHIHDMDYYPTRSLTCLQHPLDKIMKTGFTVGKNGTMRPAKRIMTASFMACMSMQDIQNEMHGGQAIPAFDFYMAPYVRMSFKENMKKYAEAMDISEELAEQYSDIEFKDYVHIDINDSIPDYINEPNFVNAPTINKLIQFAMNATVKDVHQAMEAFIHNMNSIRSRGGNQTVFSSINYGTDTSAEGRCVIRELLNSTYEGVGNGETAIFPIQIWKKKRGVNFEEGEPNYDLFKLACKVTAKRFFPNFINLDAPFNQNDKWRADDPERYKYECVDYNELITVRYNGEIYENVKIGDVYKLFKENLFNKQVYDGYVSTEGNGVEILDINGFTEMKKIIKNENETEWYEIELEDGTKLTVTENHPLIIKDKGTVKTKDLKIGDEVYEL